MRTNLNSQTKFQNPNTLTVYAIIITLEKYNILSIEQISYHIVEIFKKMNSFKKGKPFVLDDLKQTKQSIKGNALLYFTRFKNDGKTEFERFKNDRRIELFINENNKYFLKSDFYKKIDINYFNEIRQKIGLSLFKTTNNNNLNQNSSKNDELDQEIDKHTNKEEKRALIKVRRNHSKWAKDLKNIHNWKCAICGISEKKLLIAGHIIPYSKNIEKQDDLDNGIVFCVFHDKLFEVGFISFDEEGYLIYNNEKSYNECKKIINEYEIFNTKNLFKHKNTKVKILDSYLKYWKEIKDNIKEKNTLLKQETKK